MKIDLESLKKEIYYNLTIGNHKVVWQLVSMLFGYTSDIQTKYRNSSEKLGKSMFDQQQEIKQLKGELDSWKRHAIRLDDDLNLTKNYYSNSIPGILNEYAELQEKYNELVDEKGRNDSAHKELSTIVENQRNIINDLETSLAEADSKVEALKDHITHSEKFGEAVLDNLCSKRESLETKLAALQEHHYRLVMDYDSVDRQLTDLEKDHQHLLNEYNSLKQFYILKSEALQETEKYAKAQISDLNAKVNQIQKILEA